jgi:hypothetical protein
MKKIEELIEQSQTTLSYIRDKEYAWEVNSINNNLARIQELLCDIATDDKPEPEPEPEKSDVRIAMDTGDWGSFFDSLTLPK